ncbi:2-oxoglutarate dehydrogenase E1 component [Anaerophaga thermohalophila]|jgi:2-oxoglutarate dehydrogenase E1 component|uniref:2-oxoglutarate dehydrogenase E1 component n=1 Tax=Anaerophaga thermohalophila TaxID=177400 RepID=UPI0002EDADA5|nr:2-oxoglutarate dehydrogenase E1 component [Anaerophaga thermohalophila]
MDSFSFVGNSDIEAIEKLYEDYRNNPDSVDESMRNFFRGFDFAFRNFNHSGEGVVGKEFNVINLIHGYRQRGHLFTATNPVRTRRKYFPTLDIENFGLSEDDLDVVFQAGKEIGLGPVPLRDIISHLKQTYCGSVGVEYLYIRHPEMVSWLKRRMERVRNTPSFTVDKKMRIFHRLKEAAGFESFIHRKFVGQKRFSLEGSEVLIPGLDAIIEKGAALGIKEVMIGMSHRGRLNVLSNILKKPVRDIFNEFNGDQYDDSISLGDVKYHLGYDNSIDTLSGTVKVNLLPNPSHLEAVTPVVEGLTRSRAEQAYDKDFNKVIPLVIHGDSAIAGQGVVYEVVQMAGLNGYSTGGTIHIVINNQVGFTTNYLDARSSTYSTDVGKVTRSPVFHINGDDAEAMVYALELAVEYRQTFHTDVFIDILSYRKHGHNEGDEPRFTQPTLYKAIATHPNPRDIYARKLIEENVLTKKEIEKFQNDFNQMLETGLAESQKTDIVHIRPFLQDIWGKFRHAEDSDFNESPQTGVDKDQLIDLAEKINTLPADKKFFRKLEKLVEDRKKMVKEDRIDWAMGELLAYASLLMEGHPVRISGQDSVRGTFAHRHAGFTLEDMAESYFPLQHLSPEQAIFNIYNSPLNEYGVMGFEYGFALGVPDGLTIWEAQFGDFFNVGQVVVDQFISSAEEKWGLKNGLVLFLPHGFEGQGPEHSSARIERFLNQAAGNNMQILNCTTPANLFHALRRQMKRDFRIPMVVFTPKSLLRHPLCISRMDELADGAFQEVLDDEDTDPESVKRVVLCSGKIYYDLLARKQELNARDVALIRIEQLHPFPKHKILEVIKRYPNALLNLWVQEEPENMGAWYYVENQLPELKPVPVARLASASPATGLSGLHVVGQKEIIGKVFKKCHCELKNDYCGLQCVEGKTRAEILKQHKYFETPQRFSI